MKYENLSELLVETNNNFEKFGYLSNRTDISGIGQVHSRKTSQHGVFRTNCVDNLDRTNVLQSVIARKTLLKQLFASGLNKEPTGQPFEQLPGDLEKIFRFMWTDHANGLSTLYSGTGAQKTDFTKTGKRTKQGAAKDLQISVTRYFLNNFEDPYKQNALDLLLGKISAQDLVFHSQNEARFSQFRL